MDAIPDDVRDFVDSVRPASRRREAEIVLGVLRRATGVAAWMSSTSVVGFGSYSYPYADGTIGTTAAIAFAPRRESVRVHLADRLADYADELSRLGEHRTTAGTIHLGPIDEVDLAVLAEIATRSYHRMTDAPQPGRLS